VPVGANEICIRPYGFHDTFNGRLGEASTRWLERPALKWFAARGIKLEDCAIDAHADIQDCLLFPVVAASELNPAFIEWLIGPAPETQSGYGKLWRSLPRLSAQQLGERINLRRLY